MLLELLVETIGRQFFKDEHGDAFESMDDHGQLLLILVPILVTYFTKTICFGMCVVKL